MNPDVFGDSSSHIGRRRSGTYLRVVPSDTVGECEGSCSELGSIAVGLAIVNAFNAGTLAMSNSVGRKTLW